MTQITQASKSTAGVKYAKHNTRENEKRKILRVIIIDANRPAGPAFQNLLNVSYHSGHVPISFTHPHAHTHTHRERETVRKKILLLDDDKSEGEENSLE